MAKAIVVAVSAATGFVQVWTRGGLKPYDDTFFQAQPLEEVTARITKAKLIDADLANRRVLGAQHKMSYHIIPVEGI